MTQILDFKIQHLSGEDYSLILCERDSLEPIASTTFGLRVDFLTDFSVDRLNAATQDAGDRFDELTRKGQELYRTLFAANVEQVWRDYQQRSEFLILCLRFAEAAARLEVLPWETLHDGAEFIAVGTKTTLTRLPLDVPIPEALRPIPVPLRLFGFFASPLDLQDHERLNAEREQEILLEAINDPAGQGRITAEFEDEAKLAILERSLRDGYHILHFNGHGISPRDGGGLLLEDAHGQKLHASVANVMQAVQSGTDGKATLRLAVISGCQTARTLHSGSFNDLARALLHQRVAAVIAMQFSISDEGGLKFAEVLYKQIAQGVTLERAVHAGRRILLADKQFFLNNDALAIVLLAADGACLQTTAAATAPPPAATTASYHGDRLDLLAHGFYGRRREYRKMRDALLQQGQRAVVIHGIGGIGKTALLTHAIQRLRPRFKDVMSFDCRRAALVPETILLELHRYFAAQGMPQLQALIGQNVPPDALAHEMAKLLTEWPLLIVFDNFESQLEEQRHFINEDLRVFLTKLLQGTAVGSRFLFTTRYLFDLDDEQFLQLPLGDLSRAEALMLMQKLPHLAQASHPDKLSVLEKFGGHPYALVTLDRHCSRQPLDQALLDASSLKSELREFLAIELNYQQLSDGARELLNRLAAFRQAAPVAAAEWVMGEKVSQADEVDRILASLDRNEMSDELKRLNEIALRAEFENALPEKRSTPNLENEFRELINWGFLTSDHEAGDSQILSVHSLVRDYCRDQQQGESWHSRLRKAAAFYTNHTKLLGEYDKTEAAVWSELEAFELLIEAKSFVDAAALLVNVQPILGRWGYGRYLENQYHHLLDKLEHSSGIAIRHCLGILLQERGAYDAALQQHQLSLGIFEELGERTLVASTHNQIGKIHQARGDYDSALHQFQLSLKTLGEIGAPTDVAASLHQIGMIYQARGEYDAALQQYQLSLKLDEEAGNHAGVASSLHQIGMIHENRGDHDVALRQYQRALKIRGELGDRGGIARLHNHIGSIHQFRGDYDMAVQQYQLSLKIFEEISDRTGIAALLNNIGMIHQLRGDYDVATGQYQLSLKMKEELGDRDVAGTYLNLGTIHKNRGNYDAALQQYQISLQVAVELGDRVAIASSLNQIGYVAIEIGQYTEAFRCLLSALSTFIELQSPHGGIATNNLKTLRTKWGEQEFDAAWQEANGEATPKQFK